MLRVEILGTDRFVAHAVRAAIQSFALIVDDDPDVVAVVIDGASRPPVIDAVSAVAVCEAEPSTDEAVALVTAGFCAYVTCDDAPAHVESVLSAAALDGFALPPRVAADVLRELRQVVRYQRRSDLVLTPRQHSVLEAIARGESIKQTARSLGIAIKTVENTQSRLYRRLGVRTRAQALAVAVEHGLLDAATA